MKRRLPAIIACTLSFALGCCFGGNIAWQYTKAEIAGYRQAVRVIGVAVGAAGCGPAVERYLQQELTEY